MNQADTSLKAYQKKKEEGSLKGDAKKVYEIIRKHGPITINETAKLMGKFPNRISGRFGADLRDKYDLIEEVGTEDGEKLTRNEALQRLETQEEQLKRVSDLFTQRQQDSQPSFEDQGNPINVEQGSSSQATCSCLSNRCREL